MRFKNEAIFFSPSDMITFLESPFASHMERLLLEDKSQSVLLNPKDAMLMNLQKKDMSTKVHSFPHLYQMVKMF